ncbi:MAG: hypothetical protein MHPSP_002965, partial [Paramarteilia canceri]
MVNKSINLKDKFDNIRRILTEIKEVESKTDINYEMVNKYEECFNKYEIVNDNDKDKFIAGLCDLIYYQILTYISILDPDRRENDTKIKNSKDKIFEILKFIDPKLHKYLVASNNEKIEDESLFKVLKSYYNEINDIKTRKYFYL